MIISDTDSIQDDVLDLVVDSVETAEKVENTNETIAKDKNV